MSNPKFVVDIEVCLASIDKGVEKYKKQLGEIEKYGSNIGLGDDFKKQIQEGISELQKLKTEAIQTFKELSKGKLDSSEYTKFVKEIESKMAGFNQRITMIEQTITNLSKQLGKLDKVGELSKKVANLQQSFNRFTKDVKESVVALKEFNNVVSGQSNNSNIKETIKDYEKLVNILEGLDFGSKKTSLKTADISKLEKQFSSLYDQYTKLDTALNDSDDSQFIEKTQREIAELLPKLSNVFNAIVKIKNIDVDFGGDEIFNKVGLSFKDIANELNTASSDIQVSFSQLVNKLKTSAKDVSDEVNTVATTMFQIKDGKIQIPVILDENSIKTLRPKYKELIELLQKYADANPVDVTMRLFPLNTTKKGQAEVKEAVKNINAQIANLPEGELKTSMTELYNNLEQQYQKALTLKIAVELSEDEHSVNKNLKAIQDVVNEQGITIYPKIVITDEEADKLSEKLKKLQEGFTFNITSEIKEMANSLNELLKQGNTKEWVEGFISGLDQIEQKISAIEPLVKDLSSLMLVKTSKGKNNAGNIPTEQDVNVILAFTDAMTSLKSALDKQNDIKVDIDITDIIDKMGVLKAHLGLIFGQLIEIRSMLDKRLGNQISSIGEDFVNELQKAINNNEPLKIPITPDLSSVNEFITKIESEISKFNINLNVGGVNVLSNQKVGIKEILNDANNANNLFHKMFYGLDEVAGNLDSKLVREIALSLVKGIKSGLSSTADMIKEGLKGTQYESIIEELIGDEETLNTIKKVANEVAISFANSFDVADESINNLINDIEDKIIKSGKTVHIPISVMESSIDGFIVEARSILNDKLNIDNNESDSKRSEPEMSKQITNLNRRIGNLKKKIDSVWDNWINFGKGSTEGTEIAINNVNKVIAKVGDLAVVLNDISDNFNGIDFSDKFNDASNLIFNNNRSNSDIGEIIAQMMEADRMMMLNGRSISERGFYYNLKNGKHTNTYTYDKKRSYGLSKALLYNDSIKNYDTFAHTHPRNHATMSLLELNEETNTVNGDILSFYLDYLEGIKTQIIAGMKDVEIFDAKSFFDDYGDIFKSDIENDFKELVIKFNKASQEVALDFWNNIDDIKQAFEKSGLSYKNLINDDSGNIFIGSNKDIGSAISERILLGSNLDIEDIIKDYLDGSIGNTKFDLSNYLLDIISKNLTNEEKGIIGSNVEIADQIQKYLTEVIERFNKNIQNKLIAESYDLMTPKILEKVGFKDYDESKYVTRMSINEFREKYSGIFDKMNIQDSASKSSVEIENESAAMTELYDKAIAAAKAKKDFADANKEVLESIISSLSGLKSEENGFNALNKLINNIGGKSGDEKLQKTVNGLKEIYAILNQDIGENALVRSLTELANKGTDLEHLATVLKATKKEIKNAKETVVSTEQENLKGIMGSVDVSGNARNFLSDYGEVVNLTQELKNGFIQVTSTVLGADNTFKRFVLTTQNGIDMTISKTEEHTTGLEKELVLYTKLLKASQNLNRANPNQTDEVFIEEESDTWNSIIEYAKEYGEDLGNILSITRSVRQVNDELLESFKIVGENGSVTIGAENDVVGSIQNIGNITKEYKKLLTIQEKLKNIDLSNSQKEIYTPEYISKVREMINLIETSNFNLTNEEDVARLGKLLSEATELNAASKSLDNNLGNMKQLDKLRGKIADILNDYGAMPRKLKDEFNSLKGTVEYFIKAGRISAAQADEINAKFLEINANLSESGKKYQSMGRQLLERLRSQSSQLLAQYFSFQDFIRYGRTAISTIIDLDTQLVDLRKTTKMNNDELEEFYKNSADIAKEMGVTTSEIIAQASSWSRLGYNTKEASETMAKLSSQFASISPGVSTDEAQTGLVSIMKAWDVDVDKVSRDIMDNINTLGNNFALTNGDIITGMEKAGATLSAIGTSIEDSFALFTGAQEVLQNAETVGTALKTLSLRIRGKQPLPPYGESCMLCA